MLLPFLRVVCENTEGRRGLPPSIQLSSQLPLWNDTQSKMTIPQKMRDLAFGLVTYEATAGDASEPMKPATLRVYGKLRESLVAFVGVAGFHSLASRALALARSEAPGLSAARITADGYLQGLGEFEHQTDIDQNQAGEDQLGDGGIILIARLLGLLLIFLGEVLTLRLLRDAWPDAAFDDCNSGHGRKA